MSEDSRVVHTAKGNPDGNSSGVPDRPWSIEALSDGRWGPVLTLQVGEAQ